MTDDELTWYTTRLLEALDKAKPSEALAALGVVVSILLNYMPAEKRDSITDSWFELVLANTQKLAAN